MSVQVLKCSYQTGHWSQSRSVRGISVGWAARPALSQALEVTTPSAILVTLWPLPSLSFTHPSPCPHPDFSKDQPFRTVQTQFDGVLSDYGCTECLFWLNGSDWVLKSIHGWCWSQISKTKLMGYKKKNLKYHQKAFNYSYNVILKILEVNF